ncbi:MAG: hypothetical protein ABFQ82_02495 [Thermodesulfobacteriota bacterium]
MEKWQLAGIISGDSKSEIILPGRKRRQSSLNAKRSSGGSKFFKLVQGTLRRMTEVIALF